MTYTTPELQLVGAAQRLVLNGECSDAKPETAEIYTDDRFVPELGVVAPTSDLIEAW